MKLKLLSGLLALALAPGVDAAVKNLESVKTPKQTPKDPAIINQERILYWMEQRGELEKNVSESERKNALQKYLGNLKSHHVALPKLVQSRVQKNHDTYKKGSKLAQKNGQNKTVKVLAVLIDFPDLKHDAHGLSASDTDMYYPSYPVSHYQDLMFSKTGFTGPGGENLTSGYQYYQNESGDTFNF